MSLVFVTDFLSHGGMVLRHDTKRFWLPWKDTLDWNKWRRKVRWRGNWLTRFTWKMTVKMVSVCVISRTFCFICPLLHIQKFNIFSFLYLFLCFIISVFVIQSSMDIFTRPMPPRGVPILPAFTGTGIKIYCLLMRHRSEQLGEHSRNSNITDKLWLTDYVKIRCEKLVQGFYAVACWLAVKFVSVLMKSNVSLFCHRATSVHNSFHNLPMCCQYLPCQPEEQELTWMRGKMTSQHRSSCSSSSIKSSM